MGFYVPGTSWLHRLDPAAKLLFVVWAVVAPFILPLPAIPLFVVAGFAAGLSAGLGLRYLRFVALGGGPILASILIVNSLFFPGARDFLVSFGPFNVTREGLNFALPIAGRVLAAVASAVAFVMTTRPDDLMEALVQRGVSPRLAFVVLSAIQTIPRMLDKAARILDAQQARGLPTGGGYGSRVRAIVPLLGPLVIGSLIDVRERALALEARAFGGPGVRTAYRLIEARPVDRTLGRVAVVMLAALPVYAVARIAGIVP
jgi:energy-coupling factor transport system permease protein